TAICGGFQYELCVVLEDGQLDAFHGRAAELRAILVVIPAQKLSQIDGSGRESRLKSRIDCIRGTLVPGADILANITPVKPIAKPMRHRRLKRLAMLYVQVRNASTRIELIGRGDRLCR